MVQHQHLRVSQWCENVHDETPARLSPITTLLAPAKCNFFCPPLSFRSSGSAIPPKMEVHPKKAESSFDLKVAASKVVPELETHIEGLFYKNCFKMIRKQQAIIEG